MPVKKVYILTASSLLRRLLPLFLALVSFSSRQFPFSSIAVRCSTKTSWSPHLHLNVLPLRYYHLLRTIGKHILSLIALSLKLDERFFETIGALDSPMAFVRLLHYPGELKVEDYDNYGASAHSDYGMITLLATDGVPGLQICREKDRRPQLWEDVPHIEGAFIVNIGDMLERWTNCLFRSTMHRVVAIGTDRYSVAFFLDPNSECLVECLESCCNETFPPRFPPVRSGDYLKERLKLSYST